MTHQNHQTNGASLEDCHTNFFALTALHGIKWRKFLIGERTNATGDPLDDPILRSYSRCLECDILCVWRRVAAPKQEPDPNNTISNNTISFDIVSSHVHPPLSLTAAKELWIFWYGEEPDLEGLVDPELLKNSDTANNSHGAWECGMSYECRSLLFKALHNLIERCLLSKDIVRLGKWFVQPCTTNERIFGKSSQHLSFSFAFFVHGDNVCASIDLREHPAVRPLSPEYLAEAVTSQSNSDARPKPVILAPFGMAATLTGNSYKSVDPATEKLLEDWSSFYPLCNKDNSDLPPIVEVISGGVKMRYPSKYVLVTDLDDMETTSTSNESPSHQLIETKSLSLYDTSSNSFGNPASIHIPPSSATTIPERVWQDCITNPLASLSISATTNPSVATSATTASSLIPSNNINNSTNDTEQATESNSGNNTNSNNNNNNSNTNNNNNNTTNNNSDSKACWDFVDPTQKTPCSCTKCKKHIGGSRSNSIGGFSSSSGSGKLFGSSRPEKSSRLIRVPFHKRQTTTANICGQATNANQILQIQSMASKSLDATPTIIIANTATATGRQTPATTSSVNASHPGANTASADNFAASPAVSSSDPIGDNCSALDTLPCQRATNPGTPHGGASSYSRNSIGDSMPVPSVGSPGSAVMSPHPNSTLSQPTSVPPSDQLLSAISPHPPTSVPNMQPPTPLEHIDKNTPAPTPTDQHDNKSVTASPYVQQTPSIEPPSSAEPAVAPSNCGGLKKFEIGLSQNEQRPNITTPGNGGGNSNVNTFISLLKRPLLSTKDYENSMDDDFLVPQLLYDYSSWDAWMDHPVKRFKPNEDTKPTHRKMQRHNLYDGHAQSQPPMPSPTSSAFGYMLANDNQIKREITDSFDGVTSEETSILQAHEIKKEPIVDSCKDKGLTGNLYTNEGLQVSYNDLDQIFDNSDDNSTDETFDLKIQVHTPPDSNKSNGCGIEEIKRSINSTNPNTSILRPEELSKMFPTPPSHEQHHPNSSPCSGGAMDIQLTDINEGVKIKQEIYPDLGSPLDEPIEDWSYVFIPPTICKFVGSSKYAPLTNLPSQSLPPIVLPPNCVYKPSWQQPQRQQQEQSQQMQQQQQQQHQQQQQQQQQQHQHHQQQQQQQQQQLHSQQQSSLHSAPPSHNTITNSTNQRSNTPNNMTLAGMMEREKLQPQIPQSMMMNQLSCPPNVMQQIVMRTGMSPISPAAGSTMPAFQSGSPMNHHMSACRRTPIHPPPPYELAVSSPATSTSSYLNKQYNSQEPETPSSATRAPEANSLLVNVLLYDTALNVFRDHNFDSCTLCVCNADAQKCVGNIRGSDSGIYVALPGSSFNPAVGCNGNVGSSAISAGGVNSATGPAGLRNISAFGGIDSPSCNGNGMVGNLHQTGYVDEDFIRCQCGFSAVVNRRLAHRSGLFYEDEMEITGMAEDPALYKKKPLLACIQTASIDSTASKAGDSNTVATPNQVQLPQAIMDLLRDQCTIIQTSSSSIQRALDRCKRRKRGSGPNVLNILEFTDANDVICLAIEQGRIAFEVSAPVNVRLEMETYRPVKSNISVHRWPYVLANGTRNNQDIVRIMKSMQPLLQNAFHTKCRPRIRETTCTVKGPLTWREFHRLAGRSTGQCEPQPIPSVIVGHEKDWLSVAPYAIYYWDKLLLEPYSYARDVVYLVVVPENDYVVNRTKTYFKELSTTYEMCKLGRHTPIKGWDGILQVGPKNSKGPDSTPLEDWFQMLGSSKLAEQIRMYASAFLNLIAPYLQRVPTDKSLLDPPEGINSNSSANLVNKDRPMHSPMPPPSTPDPSQPGDKAPSTPKPEGDQDHHRESPNTSATTNSPVADPLSGTDDDINPPVIVIYVVEPFTCGSDSSEIERIACLSLLRCYSELLSAIPESVRSNINFQIISLDSILELGRNRSRLRFSDEMRCLALSVFSQCRRFLSHTSNVKSLTGFGTAANMELFLKNKDEKNRAPYKMYTPPYILAPFHEKSEKTDTFRLKSVEQQYSVMYCNYCVSEDQSWLLATATDDRGELLETITINIDIPNRSRRRRAPARRLGLQKLMDFILGIISQTVQPWRLVVGRIGRIGHGELKSWSWLLSKQNLQKASKQLKDICKQCSLMYPHSVPSILSACLVTLEPDSKLRVMPDQFTPDERFSQISMQNPLSTPQDVTCTHILVFPTSAVSQSSQKEFNELNENQAFENDDNLIFDFGEDPEDPIGDVNSLGEIFDWDQVPMQQNSPERNSNHGSPGRMEDNRSRQSPGPGGNNFNSTRNMHDAQDMEEVGTVLQQPLAVGYFVSTAPTGRMPSWFWASCPHLEDVCPVFLKTALHLHVPGIQQTTDDPLAQSHSSANDHPLDSTLTADVLRYVLEGYNVLSWLSMDSNTHDRLSCLPIHVQVLMQLYHMTAAMA